jgi:uncharacterized protein YjbI with pentapeptide repeats
MGKFDHFAKLEEGVQVWNQWREDNPHEDELDFSEAEFEGTSLEGANLSSMNFTNAHIGWSYLNKVRFNGSDLSGADLSESILTHANFGGANLKRANLSKADLRNTNFKYARLFRTDMEQANLVGANLTEAKLFGANLEYANLSDSDLTNADLTRVELVGANLTGAVLRGADLAGASIYKAKFDRADLTNANLGGARLVDSSFEGANLTGCSVYGASVWDLRLSGAIQSNLVITPYGESAIQVDNIEVAQFVYLLLNNERIRHVIDTITSKVVLILGRFTTDRKAILDAIRDELRKRDYLPILFDFEKPDSKDLTGTVTTLANMARFIIADLTDPSSVPHELAMIAPGTIVPVQTILLNGQREYAMFPDLMRRHHWVLEPYQYQSQQLLLDHLEDRVIAPAEAKASELRRSL